MLDELLHRFDLLLLHFEVLVEVHVLLVELFVHLVNEVILLKNVLWILNLLVAALCLRDTLFLDQIVMVENFLLQLLLHAPILLTVALHWIVKLL